MIWGIVLALVIMPLTVYRFTVEDVIASLDRAREVGQRHGFQREQQG